MRAKEFTFKKTKRIKTVTEYRAISVDMTESEAKELLAYLDFGTDVDVKGGETFTPEEQSIGDLYDALKAFVGDNS